jgi:hypothetical protein
VSVCDALFLNIDDVKQYGTVMLNRDIVRQCDIRFDRADVN